VIQMGRQEQDSKRGRTAGKKGRSRVKGLGVSCGPLGEERRRKRDLGERLKNKRMMLTEGWEAKKG